MSDEQPRMSRREMRAKGLLAPILDGASPLDDLTPTAEIRLKRLTRKEMREREAGLTRDDSGSTASNANRENVAAGGLTAQDAGAQERFASSSNRSGSAHESTSRASHAATTGRTSTHQAGHASKEGGFSTTGNITPVATVAAAEVGLVEGRWPAAGDARKESTRPSSGGAASGGGSDSMVDASGAFPSVVPDEQKNFTGQDKDQTELSRPFESQSSSTSSMPKASAQSIPTPTQSVGPPQLIPTSTQSIPASTQSIPTSTQSIPASTESFKNPIHASESGFDEFESSRNSSVMARFDGNDSADGAGSAVKDRQGSRFPEVDAPNEHASAGAVDATGDDQYDPRASLKAPLLERLRRESEPGDESYSEFAPVPTPQNEVRSIDPEASSVVPESGYQEELNDIAEEDDEAPRGWFMWVVTILVGLLIGVAIGIGIRHFAASGDIQPVLDAAASVTPPGGFGV